MFTNYHDRVKKLNRERLEKFAWGQKRKQPGVAFPSASKQEHILIIRLNVSHPTSKHEDRELVRKGIMRLCSFFDRIDTKQVMMDYLTYDGDLELVALSEYGFTATIGFGLGFFEKLKVDMKKRPKKIKEMPSHIVLGDPRPYALLQTDFIIQLGSDIEDVNRWVLQHTTSRKEKIESTKGSRHPSYLNQRISGGSEDEDVDIYSVISDWATITDIHSGFQRIDGRNLLGFNDGISNPKRLSNDTVWTTLEDEDQSFTDGTYMVFQKIEHDLDIWRTMGVEKQEAWVGRSKGTGLLLGTLSKDQDRKLASELHSDNIVVREKAKKLWKRLYDEQKDPENKFFDPNLRQYKDIQIQCPVWSHVRKSNPRQADGAARSLIFRRGYLYIEGGQKGISTSGLLFICFQRDIEKGFEYIKRNFINNENFPVPDQRKQFNSEELEWRRRHGLSGTAGTRRIMISPRNGPAAGELEGPEAHNTGRDGLSGPSELGVYPQGQVPITHTLGGGYYFIPPIPNKKISNISEQFFE